jgi:hypothetical protein
VLLLLALHPQLQLVLLPQQALDVVLGQGRQLLLLLLDGCQPFRGPWSTLLLLLGLLMLLLEVLTLQLLLLLWWCLQQQVGVWLAVA